MWSGCAALIKTERILTLYHTAKFVHKHIHRQLQMLNSFEQGQILSWVRLQTCSSLACLGHFKRNICHAVRWLFIEGDGRKMCHLKKRAYSLSASIIEEQFPIPLEQFTMNQLVQLGVLSFLSKTQCYRKEETAQTVNIYSMCVF